MTDAGDNPDLRLAGLLPGIPMQSLFILSNLAWEGEREIEE